MRRGAAHLAAVGSHGHSLAAQVDDLLGHLLSCRQAWQAGRAGRASEKAVQGRGMEWLSLGLHACRQGHAAARMQCPTRPPPTCGAAGGVVDCHLAALGAQGEGNGLADAAARARHQAHTALHCMWRARARAVQGLEPKPCA